MRTPANSAVQFIDYSRAHLQADYKLDRDIAISRNAFSGFAYWSPVADLHWYLMATEIRCHVVEFVFMNHDPKTLAQMVTKAAAAMKLPSDGSAAGSMAGDNGAPVCIGDYASRNNVIERVDPIFSEQHYNPVPVRIVIDRRGRVKHIHYLSAFPDQARAIGDALKHWKFKPYLHDGNPLEVETGIMFGRAPQPPIAPTRSANLKPLPAHPGS